MGFTFTEGYRSWIACTRCPPPAPSPQQQTGPAIRSVEAQVDVDRVREEFHQGSGFGPECCMSSTLRRGSAGKRGFASHAHFGPLTVAPVRWNYDEEGLTMLDHVSIPAGEFERSARFYDAALAPLGLERIRTPELDGIRIADYGVRDTLAFSVGAPMHAPEGSWIVQPLVGMHVAFVAPSRASADAFHAAGMNAGGQDNGAPGLRPEYEPNYYAAYLIDPDGHHVEAVCRASG